MSILIKNTYLDGKITDVYIEGNLISQIGENIEIKADEIINGTNKAILPGLMNGHSHSPMVLLRGYGDDLNLYDWLNKYIWPIEAKMTGEDIFWGSKMACLEMIKNGTTFFADMYWKCEATAAAVAEMGLRVIVSESKADAMSNPISPDVFYKRLEDKYANIKALKNDRIRFMVGPHAIYSTTIEDLKVVKEFSERYDSLVHIHVSETKKEVEDAVRKKGARPVQYLENLGLVNDKLIAAHCVWLDETEAKIMAKNNAGIIHCPTSNSKLSAGAFNYKMLKETGVKKIGIGTDGACSNNSLDMFSELKTAALIAKLSSMEPTTFNVNELWSCVNKNQAEIYRLNCGEIKEGNLADLILVDLENVLMQPQHNMLSNLIYSANGSVVDTTICNGKVLMKNKIVEGEEQIIQEFKKHVKELFARV